MKKSLFKLVYLIFLSEEEDKFTTNTQPKYIEDQWVAELVQGGYIDSKGEITTKGVDAIWVGWKSFRDYLAENS